jgi:hypothetical protein
MKYKRIKSFLHNFAHSFFSLMNYVDNTYIIDLLPDIVRGTESQELRISFPDGRITPTIDCPESLKKSIGYWANSYATHATKEGIDPTKVKDVQLVVRSTITGMHYRVVATDDRGVAYDIAVTNTL